MKDLSAIAEVVRETSSVRRTEQAVQERTAFHIKRLTSFIVNAQQRASVQGNRMKALLTSKEDDMKLVNEALQSI